MAEGGTVRLEYVHGVEGPCVYLNGYRIAGPKPWGGGQIVRTWEVAAKDIRHALELPLEAPVANKKKNPGRKARKAKE